jgi:protein-tyrosine phosphatase
MPSIIFVCTANQFRSPIAAALFRKKLAGQARPGKWEIASAGTWTTAGLASTPVAGRLARACGVDLEGHHTALVSHSQLSKFDLVLVMEAGHREALLAEFPSVGARVFLLSEVVDQIRYDIPDPARAPEHAEKFLHELCELIERGYETICKLAEAIHSGEVNHAHPGGLPASS